MDYLLSLLGKFMPVAFTLLGLWISAFDKKERLTRAGKFILPGLVTLAFLVYAADELDKKLAEISSAQETKRAQYQIINALDKVSGNDIRLILSGAAESVRGNTHPRFLQRDWQVSIVVGGVELSGLPVAGYVLPTRRVQDEEEGREYPEARIYSQFYGSFRDLSRAEKWNRQPISICMGGPRSFFVRKLDDWIMKESEEDYFSRQRVAEKIEPQTFDFSESEDHDDWRILPMRIRAEVFVREKMIGATEGHVYYFAYKDDGEIGTVNVDMPPIVVPAGTFPTARDFLQVPTGEAEIVASRMRIIGWISAALSMTSAIISVKIQLSSSKTEKALEAAAEA